MGVKRLRGGEETKTETMLDSLPESLQLHILSFLDARHAVETSVLSKSWVSSWTCIPVLNFSSDSFEQLHVFDNFVVNVLSRRRQPVKLDRLTFKRGGKCNAEILKKVFDYAFLHGVEELEASINYTKCYLEKGIWPIRSWDSLRSLKLLNKFPVDWSLSGSFKNLTNLHLQWIIIKDHDPFSGFPALDKLKLVACYLATNGKALNVHALQLSEFTFIYYCQEYVNCELTTPKLRYFKWRGGGLPRLKAHLPVLDTAVIKYNGYGGENEEKRMFDNLLMMFDALQAAKSLRVSAHVVRLLAMFPVNGCCSPFRDLKFLKLDFKVYIEIESRLFFSETLQLFPGVKAYLLHMSRDTKCTILNYPNEKSSCSSSQKSICDTTQRQATQQTGSFALSRPKRMVEKPTWFLD